MMFIHCISVCRGFESNQPENAMVEILLESLSAADKRPREKLGSCSVEVLHGWSLVSLLRPPFMAGGVFFHDQMDGSDIPTEIYTMETTCMRWPD